MAKQTTATKPPELNYPFWRDDKGKIHSEFTLVFTKKFPFIKRDKQ